MMIGFPRIGMSACDMKYIFLGDEKLEVVIHALSI